ncbi:hypothetical protein SLEP1_g22120 [Rubroshorea leprosula]|uniref:Uncharacterized protein n=1 Tax=Rubroshorea leprosula TaxID=152421 RepID=A0AAV5J871_9ROSI|nr:hypothetical protein SLEP1_g22120 [Rubroshorea leprosula]
MHRSSSSSPVSEEVFSNSSPFQSTETTELSRQQLPTLNPLSNAAKKERSRLRSAENAIHIIPLVLVLCAIILWLFSKPGTRE